MVSVSINPTYKCNQNCEYCYLGFYRKNPEILDLKKLEKHLKTLDKNLGIEDIDIYGGEISLLETDYLNSLILLCKKYSKRINLVSNLYDLKILEIAREHNITLGISYNEERPDYKYIKSVISTLSEKEKENLVLNIVVLPSVVSANKRKFLKNLDTLGINIFFLQYSEAYLSNSRYHLTNRDFSNSIIEILEEYKNKKYSFQILNSFQLNNPFDFNHLYINPFGHFSWVSFKKCNLEIFLNFSTIKQCIKQYEKDLKDFESCMSCKYYKKCLAEHLKHHNIEDECCGLPSLIDYLESSKNETNIC